MRPLLLALLVGCAQAPPGPAADPPNIVSILADDLGTGGLHPHPVRDPDGSVGVPIRLQEGVLEGFSPAEVERLTGMLQRIIDARPNDVPVALRKTR